MLLLPSMPGDLRLLVLEEADGSIGPKSREAMELLANIDSMPEIVRIPAGERARHPAMERTRYPWLPQLLYRDQLLGSLEFIREFCESIACGCLSPLGDTTPVPHGDKAPVWSLVASAGLVLSCSADGVLREWVAGGVAFPTTISRRLALTRRWLTSVSLVGDSSAVVSSSAGVLYTVDLDSFSVVAAVRTGDVWTNTVSFDATTDTVVSAGDDGCVRLWKFTDSGLVEHGKVAVGLGWVNSLHCADGVAWIAFSSGHVARLELSDLGSPTHTHAAVSQYCLNTIDVRDGLALVGGIDGVPIVIDQRLEQVALGVNTHASAIWGARFTGEGDLLTVDAGGYVFLHRRDGRTVETDVGEPLVALSRGCRGEAIFAGTRAGVRQLL